jgi:hypothetical protein
MARSTKELDIECESISGLPGDERTRCSARCNARPAFAWFDAGLSIGRSQTEVHLVRSLAVECSVRTMCVVPGDEVFELPAKRRPPLGHHGSAGALVFHGSDEPLHYSDAPVLSSRAEARTDSLSSAPALETPAPEDAVFVANQVLRRYTRLGNHPSEKAAYHDRPGASHEDPDANRTPGVVVNHHSHPPAEWPTLWECRW